MGKMPEGLRKYWAKHGRGRKKRSSGRVVHTARRRYFGRKRRGGSGRTIPIMGLATAGALGAGILANQPGGVFGGDSPLKGIERGDFKAAGMTALGNLQNPNTYYGVAVPVAFWIVGRLLLGKRKITKKVSLF
jgi:hypothetical protein